MIDMSDYIPDYITNPDYKWTYCPYCDYSPLYRKHHLNGYRPEYKRIWTCACGQRSKKKRLSEKRDPEPWYIKRTWRRQFYCGDGCGTIKEYAENYSYWGTYPISQHLDEVQRDMSIDTQLRLRI